MEAWLASSFDDEDGPMAVRGRSVILRVSKEEVRAIAAFLQEVAAHLDTADFCHMHLRDHMPGWNRSQHADIEITVERQAG